MKKRAILLIVLVLGSFVALSQRIQYESNSNLFFGLNAGATWHDSDVKSEYGPGAGFMFGGSFNHDYGKVFTYDLRFRYLTGRWSGLDDETTGEIGQNNAVNTLYQDEVLQNFQSTQHRAALELAIHLNWMKEKTKIDPYIFGGIGVTGTQTMGDLLNSDGLPYDFASGQGIEGNYNTPLDMNASGESYSDAGFDANFLPSLGFGLGYYFTNRFSIGFEHKTTFFNSDYFDGTITDQTGAINGNNDRYNYTGLYARWYFPSGGGRTSGTRTTTVAPPPTTPDVNTYTDTKNTAPKVNFTNPSSSPYTTTSTKITLRADIKNVISAKNVTFRRDGEEVHDFSFNGITNKFQSMVELEPGQNIFRLKASNEHGSDDDVMIIILQEKATTPTPPTVQIVTPSDNPHTTSNEKRTVTARIKNVYSKENITLEVNGKTKPKSEFDFNSTKTNNFSTTVNLNPGHNIVKVSGTNEFGSANDEVTIIYNPIVKEEPIDPPVVQYTNPNKNITVTNSSYTLIGNVYNVDGKDNITFSQNGNKNKNFSYNKINNRFASSVVLSPGPNAFKLSGTNKAGTDQKTVIITYSVPSVPKPPIVDIIKPENSPYTTDNEMYYFKSTVLNISKKSQVSMRLNGANYTSFSFNENDLAVTANLNLNEGSNTVKITATNQDGTDTKSTIIIYKKPVVEQPPVVEFINPSSNPYTTNNPSKEVLATVKNVDAKNQINVTVNGNNVSNFNYNLANRTVTFPVNLVTGANLIGVSASNNAGSDSKSTMIIYEKPEQKLPPVVTYLDPVDNPTTVYGSAYEVKSQVKNVKSKQDIKVRINGVSTNNFTYNSSSDLVTFTTSLLEGSNVIEVTGTNEHGQDVETTTIIYDRPDPIKPPVVTITTPAQTTYTVSTSSTPITATLLNVASAQQITVLVNDKQVNNFSFNNTTKVLTFNMTLNEGENTLLIKANNDAGSDFDDRVIIYDKEEIIPAPEVRFINPSSPGKTVTNPTYQMVAEVKNVESKNGLKVTFNGQVINANAYSFNIITKEVRYNTNLSLGNNYFEVKGTNLVGSDQASTSILYVEPEPDCDQPVVEFIAPQNSTTVEEENFNVKALVHNVNSSNDITLKVNGVAIGNFSYSTQTHELLRKVKLENGNNVIEIIAETDCGRSDVTTIIKYQPPTASCDDPIINLVSPQATGHVTQNTKVNINATVSNIDNMQQITLFVNSVPKNFNYDLGTHSISANVDLEIGSNIVIIETENECGFASGQWIIKREKCKEPVISLSSSPSGTQTENEEITISGTINDVKEADISFTQNGTSKNFVYNSANQSFSANLDLVEGLNNFLVVASNECGDVRKEIKITYTPKVVVDPPIVNITNPSSSPYETEEGAYSVVADVKNVSSSNQISVKVNGTSRNFNYNASKVTFNQNLVEGNNIIEVSAINEGGSDSDTKTIVYTKPVKIDPPVVTFTNPSSASIEIEDGVYEVKGNVTNLTSTNQLSIDVNNVSFSDYSATMNNGIVTFTLSVSVSSSHPSYKVKATGTNEVGSDNETVLINRKEVEEPTDDPSCLPEVTAEFSDDDKSVTTTSDKDLSNVVVKYYDGETQKFDNLSGKTKTFTGTGSNKDKCIIGVWIKSGCNKSDDGPGYGEWVPNDNYDGSCEEVPCEAPAINILSSTDVTNEEYTFEASISNVNGNQVNVSLNGNSVDCSFDEGASKFTCQVKLVEGNNTFSVIANGCETVNKTVQVKYTIPCEPITYSLVYPSSTSYETTDDMISVNFTTKNAKKGDLSASLNGTALTANLVGSSVIMEGIPLNEGQNIVEVTLKNECSNKKITFNITYNPPSSCGPRINPGNSEWQFCLVTPAGTFNRSDLQNSNFSYKGSASSLFFLPIAGGGDVFVNGNEYSIKNGNYYLFEGNISVDISTKHPGSMGHWQICIDADSAPTFGNGNKRPKSPCEGTGNRQESQGNQGNQSGQNRQGRERMETPSDNDSGRKQEKPSSTSSSETEKTNERPSRENTNTAPRRERKTVPQQSGERGSDSIEENKKPDTNKSTRLAPSRNTKTKPSPGNKTSPRGGVAPRTIGGR